MGERESKDDEGDVGEGYGVTEEKWNRPGEISENLVGMMDKPILMCYNNNGHYKG